MEVPCEEMLFKLGGSGRDALARMRTRGRSVNNSLTIPVESSYG